MSIYLRQQLGKQLITFHNVCLDDIQIVRTTSTKAICLEAMKVFVERLEESNVWGINFGETEFTEDALLHFINKLEYTTIGFLFIESKAAKDKQYCLKNLCEVKLRENRKKKINSVQP